VYLSQVKVKNNVKFNSEHIIIWWRIEVTTHQY